MIVQTDKDLNGLKEIGKIVAEIRNELTLHTKPGVTTKEIDAIGGKLFKKFGAVSAPISTYDFPGYTCICVNEEVAHGIPGSRVIKEGDLVNIDVSGSLNGYFADTGHSFVVGKGEPVLEDLLHATKETFAAGLKKFKAGSKQNGVGRAVYQTAKDHGFTVIKNLTGHGVGLSLHDSPEHIFNYYNPRDTKLFKEGEVIAFEPFVSTKAEDVYQLDDGWTLTTVDQSFVAQYEHTIIVTKDEPIILTK
ncbi:type I methionyl aminopeptidase [Alkalicoccobacillus porphyridii]|uniref:Methionine aminopeptidase n=1 Tax=Alkalicoccobacillus porphyridii TaxID=2597270 RepID=A0A554A1M7_9BACI|nr:type I methionyl aminopeptidase [Alkalicoccobacillus porphyridii]TSB47601.1 type I methionyl aminopeptidase [Alkalicoccobacillus porphyridii]